MVKAMFERVRGNLLRPVDPAAERLVESLKMGQGVVLEAKRSANVRFHRKLFALMNLAFELWEPPAREVRGQAVSKNFETFRKDLVVLAGFYDAHYSPDGSVRFEPHSLSFKACEEDKRQQVYKGILGVVWERILRHAHFGSPDEVDAVVNQLLAFE